VASRNEAALKLDEHLGFKREGYLRQMLPDDDVVLMGMIREDCRWLNMRAVSGKPEVRKVG
jgi:RimJ/RimL family protein N-acetyltransferase